MPIASMGDIAFLLIIFFLVASEVSKDRTDLQILLPDSEYVKKPDASVIARVSVDENGVAYFDGALIDGPKDVEWGVRALVDGTVSDDQRHVQFKCDAALTREQFEPFLKAIASGGGIIEAVGNLPQ